MTKNVHQRLSIQTCRNRIDRLLWTTIDSSYCWRSCNRWRIEIHSTYSKKWCNSEKMV